MNTANTAHLGHYIPFHPKLKELGLRTSDQLVFGKIANLIANTGKAFICLEAFSQDFGYAKGTISRALKRLADRGIIKYTGQKKHGVFPYIEIPFSPTKGIQETPKKFAQSKPELVEVVNTDVKTSKHPGELEEIRVNKNKQQPAVAHGIIKKLKSFNISAKESKRLLDKYPVEQIERQISNLELKLQTNNEVKSKAGWLIKAIREDFEPSKAAEEQQQLAQDQKLRKASQMAQNADYLLSSSKPEEAINLAQNSLELHETSLAKEVIQRAQNEITKKKQQEEAVAALPPETFAQILAEEKEKQRISLRRFGITNVGEEAQKGAYVAALERAVALQK
jgi:predicted transcriptional regulator